MLHLKDSIHRFQKNGAESFHFDIMDGEFVPRIGLSEVTLEQVLNFSKIPVNVHLMMDQPSTEVIEYVCELDPNSIVLHVEACKDILRLIKLVQEKGCKAGVALNPTTPISSIQYIIEIIDAALIMCYSPGTTTQTFLPRVLKKIQKLRILSNKRGENNFLIMVDGDINEDTIPSVIESGANVLTLGSSALFNKDNTDPIIQLQEIKVLSEKVLKQVNRDKIT